MNLMQILHQCLVHIYSDVQRFYKLTIYEVDASAVTTGEDYI